MLTVKTILHGVQMHWTIVFLSILRQKTLFSISNSVLFWRLWTVIFKYTYISSYEFVVFPVSFLFYRFQAQYLTSSDTQGFSVCLMLTLAPPQAFRYLRASIDFSNTLSFYTTSSFHPCGPALECCFPIGCLALSSVLCNHTVHGRSCSYHAVRLWCKRYHNTTCTHYSLQALMQGWSIC